MSAEHKPTVGYAESFDGPPTAQARCSCGWVGPEREVAGGSVRAAGDAARDDHDDHVIAITRSAR